MQIPYFWTISRKPASDSAVLFPVVSLKIKIFFLHLPENYKRTGCDAFDA